MNIYDWPIQKKMLLPDYCFGRRWPIGVSERCKLAEYGYAISPEALPEITVIWELLIWMSSTDPGAAWFGFRLGDQLPANDAEYLGMEDLFPFYDFITEDRSSLWGSPTTNLSVRRLKMPVRTLGRRLVVRFGSNATAYQQCFAGIVVSSVPTEIPDCLNF